MGILNSSAASQRLEEIKIIPGVKIKLLFLVNGKHTFHCLASHTSISVFCAVMIMSCSTMHTIKKRLY